MNVVGFKAQNSVRLSLSQHEATACRTLRRADPHLHLLPYSHLLPQAPHILSAGPLGVRRIFQKPTLCINPIFLRDGGHGPTLGHFSSLQQPSPFRGVQPKGQQHMADLGSHLWSRDWLTTSTIARSCLYPQSTWKVCDTGANTRD